MPGESTVPRNFGPVTNNLWSVYEQDVSNSNADGIPPSNYVSKFLQLLILGNCKSTANMNVPDCYLFQENSPCCQYDEFTSPGSILGTKV